MPASIRVGGKSNCPIQLIITARGIINTISYHFNFA